MLVERADRDASATGDGLDACALIAIFGKHLQRRAEKRLTLSAAALLLRRRWKLLPSQQIGSRKG
jgi:hypothetical protein